MPALRNHRHERFCQLIKQGLSPYRAYPEAGYQPHNGSPYRLREDARVKQRLAEITKGLAMKTRVTIETISSQLDEDRQFAKQVDQAGPALNATIAKAKLHGLIVDRKESGAPGDFQGLQSAEEVLALIRSELGAEAAALLAAALARQESEPEVEQPAAIETRRAPGDTLN